MLFMDFPFFILFHLAQPISTWAELCKIHTHTQHLPPVKTSVHSLMLGWCWDAVALQGKSETYDELVAYRVGSDMVGDGGRVANVFDMKYCSQSHINYENELARMLIHLRIWISWKMGKRNGILTQASFIISWIKDVWKNTTACTLCHHHHHRHCRSY